MKSVFLTFLMFAVLFGILKLNILTLFDGSWFLLISLVIFFAVVITAVLFVGAPTKKDVLSAIKIRRKDSKDEKNK